MEQYEILDLLTGLVDRNLVVAEGEGAALRYRLLESVRQYAGERLAESELPGEAEQSRDRHLAHFLHLAEEAATELTGPDQAAWLDRLEREHGNLRTSLDWCLLALVDSEPGLRLGGALPRYFHMRGYLTEGSHTLEAVIRKHSDGPPTAALGHALQGAGNMAYFVADYDTAQGYYERSLAVRRQAGDRRGEAGALGSLGNIAQYRGDYAGARAYFEESLAINRETGNRVWEAMNLTCLASLTHDQGDLRASRAYYQEALALNRAIGNRATEATTRSGLAHLLIREGDLDGATGQFEEALKIARELGDRASEYTYLANLGMVEESRGNLATALDFYRRSMAMAVQRKEEVNRRVLISVLEEIAAALVQIGAAEPACTLLGMAAAQREALVTPIPESDRPSHERILSLVRAGMSPEAFEQSRAEGAELTVADALVFALDALNRLQVCGG